MLQSMGSQRVANDLMTEQQQQQHTIRSSNVLTSVSSMPDIYHQKKKQKNAVQEDTFGNHQMESFYRL